MADDFLSKITAPIGSVKTDTIVSEPFPPTRKGPEVAPVVAPPESPAPATAPKLNEAAIISEEDLLGNQTIIPEAQPIPATPANGEVVKPKMGRPPGSKNRHSKRRADGSFAASSETESLIPNIGEIERVAELVPADYKLMAEATFDLTTGVAATALGPEWSPKSEDERSMVTVPLAVYMKYKGMQDIPPGMALALVCTAYAAPRLREPSTAGKLRIFWAWSKEQVRRLRSK